MSEITGLREAAQRVDGLARPRASAGLVAAVVLVAEAMAGLAAWGVTALGEGQADPVLITIAVLAPAITAIGLLAAHGDAEPGNQWLAAAWIVVAVLAGGIITTLPLGRTINPAGPGTDRALFTVLMWTLTLAAAAAGGDVRAHERVLPVVVAGGLGVLTIVGGIVLPEGALLTESGPTFGYGLIGGMVVVVAVFSSVWWLSRWNERGGWSLTWSGVGLVLLTVAVVFQLAASFGSDRAWASSSALVLSALIVPGIGAAVAGLGLAGARTIARRQLVANLEGSEDAEGDTTEADSPGMLGSLDVSLGDVINLGTRRWAGAVARAELPGTGLGVDWWRQQAASMGLEKRLELVLVRRALEVARRDRANAWVVLPISASSVGPDLVDLLAGASGAQMVAIVQGTGKAVDAVLTDLRSRGVNVGLPVTSLDPEVIQAVRVHAPSMLVIEGRTVAGVHANELIADRIADIVAFASEESIAVFVQGVDDARDLPVLRDLGARYASGPAAVAVAEAAPAAAAPAAGVAQDAMQLIEAAGLREQAAPDQR